METYGKILLIAMPAFLLLILFDKFCDVWKGRDSVRNMDMISSLISSTTDVTKYILGLSFTIISYPLLVKYLSVIQLENSILIYLIAFISFGFTNYWVHRIQHIYNIFGYNQIINHPSKIY